MVHTGIVLTGDLCFEPILFGGPRKNESEMGEISFQDLLKHMSFFFWGGVLYIFFFCKKSGQKIMAKPEFTPRPDGEATEEFAADQLADLTSAPQTVRRVCCRMTGGGGGSQLSQFHMIGQNLRWDLPDSPKDFT